MFRCLFKLNTLTPNNYIYYNIIIIWKFNLVYLIFFVKHATIMIIIINKKVIK